MIKNIGIIYCDKIQDSACEGCAKCYNAINNKTLDFTGEEDVKIVFKSQCGDCRGLYLSKLKLQIMVLDQFDTELDEIYFGSCLEKAHSAMNCPMNLEEIKAKIEETFEVPVRVGSH